MKTIATAHGCVGYISGRFPQYKFEADYDEEDLLRPYMIVAHGQVSLDDSGRICEAVRGYAAGVGELL
jgi:hypothetical protein